MDDSLVKLVLNFIFPRLLLFNTICKNSILYQNCYTVTFYTFVYLYIYISIFHVVAVSILYNLCFEGFIAFLKFIRKTNNCKKESTNLSGNQFLTDDVHNKNMIYEWWQMCVRVVEKLYYYWKIKYLHDIYFILIVLHRRAFYIFNSK